MSNNNKKYILPLIILMLSIVLAVIMSIGASFLGSFCDDKVRAVWLSPNGNMLCYVYVRDCGATTDYNTRVAVFRVSDGFRSRTDNDVFVVAGNVNLTPRWVGDANIKISGLADEKTFLKKNIKIDNIIVFVD